MSVSHFIQKLEKNNSLVIENLSCESAVHFADQLRPRFIDAPAKPEFVIISFDPPLRDPAFLMNLTSQDCIYLRDAKLEESYYQTVHENLEKTRDDIVLIFERKNTPQLRKIKRWVKAYLARPDRRKQSPRFILAEYTNALWKLDFTEITPGASDD